METFHKLFGSLLAFVYHCFDRIVIQGYLPLLTRPEHIVHFFRDVHGVYPLTKDALAKRTQEYQQWVEAFARNHRIPIEWPDAEALKTKKLKKEDYVRPYGTRMERQKRFGVYFIFKSLEQGPKFGIRAPEVPDRRPALPDRDPAALPLHALLLLHPGRGARPLRDVRRVVPAVPDHLLPQRPPLHRRANSSATGSASARTITRSSGRPICRRCKRPPTGSIPR